MSTHYELVVFQQDNDANETLDIIEKHDELAGINHLAQWDERADTSPEEWLTESQFQDAVRTFSFGATWTYRSGVYTIVYSPSYGLCALYKEVDPFYL